MEAIRLIDRNQDSVIDWAEFSAKFGPILGTEDPIQVRLGVCFSSEFQFLTNLNDFSLQEAPEQVHISVTTRATEMRVMWVTRGILFAAFQAFCVGPMT